MTPFGEGVWVDIGPVRIPESLYLAAGGRGKKRQSMNLGKFRIAFPLRVLLMFPTKE
jgi:hypothetical protein